MKKVCELCGGNFNARRSVNRFCSTLCSNKWTAKHFPPATTRFKVGHKAWNAGLPISGMSGKLHKQSTKERMRKKFIGENGPNWKGGVTAENYRLRRSGKYAEWRQAVFERDNYTCKICGDKSVKGHRIRLEADHILQFAFYPALRFDVDNGRTLCQECHRKTDTWGKQNPESCSENKKAKA